MDTTLAGVDSSRARTSPKPDWGPILALANGFGGGWKSRYDRVVEAFTQGELRGAVPTYNSFWRKITALNQDSTGDLGISEESHPASCYPPAVPADASPLSPAANFHTRPTTTDPRLAALSGSGGESGSDDIGTVVIAEPFLAAAAESQVPSFRAVVGRARPSRSEEDARVRARIVTPVLTGYFTPEQAATNVRKFASGAQVDDTIADHMGDFPRATYRRYLSLTRRTVERWVAKIEADRARAKAAGEQPRQIWEVLLHRHPEDRVRAAKVTEENVDTLRQVFLVQVNFSKADVARFVRDTFGISVSTRHVQRILGQRVSEIENGMARGGVAADVIFRAKLLRDAAMPNDTWIGDHSFLRQECIDPEHPEYLKEVVDFNWEFDIAVERRTRHGVIGREGYGMHLTMWVDACTRRVLSLRVWDHAPNIRMTLASLFDAVRQFGVPDRIYTDNGSDFRSAEMRRAIEAVGVKHAFSRPYSPEGRGIIERMFRTIKEKVVCRLPGYRGRRHVQEWNVEDLLTTEELEVVLWQFVDRFINHTRHSATRRRPAEHYDALVGARSLAGVVDDGESAARFLAMLPVETRVLQPFGIEWGGLPFWTGSLCLVPDGTEVYVHFEPLRWRHVYLSVADPQGALRFLGRANSYDIHRPPPDMSEVLKIEAEWQRYIGGATESWAGERRRRQLVDASRVAGEEIAATVLDGVQRELAALDQPPALRLLSERTEEVAELERSPLQAQLPAPTAANPAELPSVVPRQVQGGGRRRRPAGAMIVNPFD